MRYELYRLSLVPRQQQSLLADPARSRYGTLRDIFLTQHAFIHRQKRFYYVPSPVQIDESSLIIGRIGRQRLAMDVKPPEEGLDDFIKEGWTASDLFINTAGDPEAGQVLAFEFNKEVGKSNAILESFVDYVNERGLPEPFDLFIAAMVNEAEFWQVMETYSGHGLTTLRFHLFAPNILRASGSVQEAMESYKKEENAEDVDIELNNKQGLLNAFTDRIREIANYALAGAGLLIAKSRKLVLFSSMDKARSISVDKTQSDSIVDRAKAAQPLMRSETE